MKKLFSCLIAWAFFVSTVCYAADQRGLTIDIVGGTSAATPIAVIPMPYQGHSTPPGTDISAVVEADLDRSGQFRSLPSAQIVEHPTRGSDIQFATWRALKQNYILVGRVLDGEPNNYRIEYELFDVNKGERLLGFAMTARSDALRDVSHQIADAIFEKITGVRGAFWTHIAYIAVTAAPAGSPRKREFALMVADSDGFNPQVVTRSMEPLMSPAWSPDGQQLAYVSFERGNSAVYIQHLSTGKRELVSSFRGINSAPSFSPDGRKLALSLSRGGNPDIYTINLATKQLTQLTRNFAIDTEPRWSPDGSTIYFTSDRSGRPQIYKMSAMDGGNTTRVTFQGVYNATPSVSYDGKKLLVEQGDGKVYRAAIMDMTTNPPTWNTLSVGPLDESPSFAPNASMVIYAARESGRGVLYAVSADARVRERLVMANTDLREPAWGPYRTTR